MSLFAKMNPSYTIGSNILADVGVFTRMNTYGSDIRRQSRTRVLS